MGSTLLDRNGHEVWGQETAFIHGLLLGGIGKLQLPDGLGDAHPGDGVMPGQLMAGIYAAFGAWSVSMGYAQLIDHLTGHYALTKFDSRHPDRPANLVLFAYDWRLSNRYNGHRLKQEIEPILERWRAQPDRGSAQLVFVCHSMGGLVARWYAEHEGGAAQIRQLVTIGTPHRGSAMAVDRLVNGVGRRLGPISKPLTRLARSMPALHQLLPGYACMADGGRLRTIAEAGGLPGLASRVTDDAALFHQQLSPAPTGYALRPIVGINQPTMASAAIDGARAKLSRVMISDTGAKLDRWGDGTVSRFAAYPPTMDDNDSALHFAAQTHGTLPGSPTVLDQLDGVLTATNVRFRASTFQLGISVGDYIVAGDPLLVSAESDDHRIALEALVVNPQTQAVAMQSDLDNHGGGNFQARFDSLPPGAWEVRVGHRGAGGQLENEVSAVAVVTDPGP